MKTALEVRGLTKAYGAHKAVDTLNFTVPDRGVVGLIGPNGSGKTTTMKMVLGLVQPTTGSVELLGAQRGAAGWSESLKRVGSMIEDPPIYQRMTARQNLRYQSIAVTGKVNEQEIDRLLKLVDLTDRADDRPRAYSLGMKQRLGIAITMIGSPDMVILDEPANGLDPAGIREIRNLLRRLPEEGTTVLVSSHQLAEVQQACDQLVILANGKLVTEGSTQAILAANTSSTLMVEVQSIETPHAIGLLTEAKCRVQPHPDGLLAVTPPEGLSGRDVNRILASAGIFASALAAQKVSLEQAFLDMTESTPPAPHTTGAMQ